MTYETKPNTGSLFKNDKKKTDKHPNATGQALVDGKWYWISAWTNKSDSGIIYQSLAFTEKVEKREQEDNPFVDMEDDIPF